MELKEFNENITKINDALKSNLVAIEHRGDKMFVMPISLIVERNRDGLVKTWKLVKRMLKMGYDFEKLDV